MDFSKPETRELYERTVRERQELLGCSRAQAEMLVAALMWEGSTSPEADPPEAVPTAQGRANISGMDKIQIDRRTDNS